MNASTLTVSIVAALAVALATGAYTQAQQQYQQQHRDHQDRVGQQQRTDDQQADPRQMEMIRGSVVRTELVQHLGENHIHLTIRDEQGRMRLVDLGPVHEVRELSQELGSGDQIQITGQRMWLDGFETFVARSVRTDEETYRIEAWAHEHRDREAEPARFREDQRWQDQQWEQERFREQPARFRDDRFQDQQRLQQQDQRWQEQQWEQDRSRDREPQVRFRDEQSRDPRALHDERHRDERVLSGRVLEIEQERHLGEQHVHLTLQDPQGRHHRVDLGPARDARQVLQEVRRGDRIEVSGLYRIIEGDPKFVARKVETRDREFRVDHTWAYEDLDRQERPARFREEQQFRDQRWDDQPRLRDDRDARWLEQQRLEQRRWEEERIRDREQPVRFRDDRLRDQRWQEQQRLEQDRFQDQRFQDQRLQDQRRDQRFEDQRLRGEVQRERPAQRRGVVMMEERVMLLVADAPQQHFLRAHQLLAQREHEQAAEEIRLAAANVELQATRADDEAGQRLDDAAERLRELAGRLDEQEVDATEVKRASSEASYALARHHQKKAEQSLEDGRAVAAAYDMRSAARAFQQALAWADVAPDQEQARAIREAQMASRQIIAGGGRMARYGHEGRFDGAGARELDRGDRDREMAEQDRERFDEARPAAERQQPDMQRMIDQAEQANEQLARAIEQAEQQIRRDRDQRQDQRQRQEQRND